MGEPAKLEGNEAAATRFRYFPYLMAAFYQISNDPFADIAGPTCNKNVHIVSSMKNNDGRF